MMGGTQGMTRGPGGGGKEAQAEIPASLGCPGGGLARSDAGRRVGSPALRGRPGGAEAGQDRGPRPAALTPRAAQAWGADGPGVAERHSDKVTAGAPSLTPRHSPGPAAPGRPAGSPGLPRQLRPAGRRDPPAPPFVCPSLHHSASSAPEVT